jgi:Helix-turn-helix domain
VSYNYRQVLGVLLSFAVKRSRVFPSLDTIARMAMVSKRTVSHAIAWLGLYGFLDKLRRIVRTSGLLGPRVRQTSNAYVLCFPKGLGGLAVAAFKISPERNNCPPSESNSEVKKGFQGSGRRSSSRPRLSLPSISSRSRSKKTAGRQRRRGASITSRSHTVTSPRTWATRRKPSALGTPPTRL